MARFRTWFIHSVLIVALASLTATVEMWWMVLLGTGRTWAEAPVTQSTKAAADDVDAVRFKQAVVVLRVKKIPGPTVSIFEGDKPVVVGHHAEIIQVLKNEGPDKELGQASHRNVCIYFAPGDAGLPVEACTVYLVPKVNELGPCDYTFIGGQTSKEGVSHVATLSSKPVEKDGLQVTVTMAKATFAADEPLAFTVQFKNVSEKPFNLLNADYFGCWEKILFQPVQGVGGWRLTQTMEEGKRKSTVVQVEPGRVLTFAADEQPKFTVKFKNVSEKPITLSDADFFWAWSIRFEDVTRNGPWQLRLTAMGMLQLAQHQRPMKEPQTLKPVEAVEVVVDLGKEGMPFEFGWEGDQGLAVPPLTKLAPGQYKLTLDIKLSKGGKQGVDYWTGQIKTEPVTFEITEKPATHP